MILYIIKQLIFLGGIYMKKQKKWIYIILTSLLFIFLLSGCSKKEGETDTKNIQQKGTEYANSNGDFSINLEGNWIQSETTNEDAILLDNEDQSLTVMVQRFSKESVRTASGAESLDDFEKFYKENAIKSVIEIANKITTQEVSNENMLFAKAEEIEATQENQTSKLFNAYLESDSSFYVFSITGIEKLYDKNIKNLKECIQTLNEK